MAVLGASSLQINSATLGSQTGSAPMFAARAWVNFDGTTATPSTIRGSGNVSSVARTATGQYTINFATAMPDINYSVSGTAFRNTVPTGEFSLIVVGGGDSTYSNIFNVSSLNIFTKFDTAVLTNNAISVCVSVFR